MNQPATIPPDKVRSILETHPGSILLDVRTPAEFAGRHAVDARNIPLDALPTSSTLSKEVPICILCEKDGRAAIAADHLLKNGYSQVHVVEGGTQAWIAAGLPMISLGKKSISIERQVRIATGGLVLLGVIFGLLINHVFLLLSGFIGAGLIFAGITDWCGMGLLLARAPWNR